MININVVYITLLIILRNYLILKINSYIFFNIQIKTYSYQYYLIYPTIDY